MMVNGADRATALQEHRENITTASSQFDSQSQEALSDMF